MEMKWKSEYHAYQIDAVSDGESKTNLSLDVKENLETNASVNVWTTENLTESEYKSICGDFLSRKMVRIKFRMPELDGISKIASQLLVFWEKGNECRVIYFSR